MRQPGDRYQPKPNSFKMVEAIYLLICKPSKPGALALVRAGFIGS
jgi:hypothetical protein